MMFQGFNVEIDFPALQQVWREVESLLTELCPGLEFRVPEIADVLLRTHPQWHEMLRTAQVRDDSAWPFNGVFLDRFAWATRQGLRLPVEHTVGHFALWFCSGVDAWIPTDEQVRNSVHEVVRRFPGNVTRLGLI